MSTRPSFACVATLVIAIAVAPAADVIAADCWDPPVAAPVSDPYREPACRWCPGNRGVEFATTPGDHARAVSTGRVTFAGDVAGRRYLVIEHNDGRRATYGLLSEAHYSRGDVVVRGAVVGVTGDRFHFGLRDGDVYIDPTPFLGRRVFRVRLVPIDGRPGRSVPSRLVCGSVSGP